MSPAANGSTGPVEVRILGPFEVKIRGAAADLHPHECRALVAMAAVLPGGVPAAMVEALLPQPGAVTLLRNQVRDWLGADADGRPRLGERDGVWRLSPDVRVDWHAFQALASGAGSGNEASQLANALALIRGELLAGVSLPPSVQSLQPALAELRAVVLRAVQRDVELARTAGDPARAEWALRQGLTLLPREDRLRQPGPAG